MQRNHTVQKPAWQPSPGIDFSLRVLASASDGVEYGGQEQKFKISKERTFFIQCIVINLSHPLQRPTVSTVVLAITDEGFSARWGTTPREVQPAEPCFLSSQELPAGQRTWGSAEIKFELDQKFILNS